MSDKRLPPFRRTTIGRDGSSSSFSASHRREEAPEGFPDAPDCPFCSGDETELMNAFGAHASVSTYWCRSCRSPFEMMRWR
jgi:hypothetical protein